MAVPIEDTPDYIRAKLSHEIAVKQAGQDEVEKLKAQLEWSQKSNELKEAFHANTRQAEAMEAAQAQIKAQYAAVPEVIYSTQATPDAMLASAKAFDEALKATQQPKGSSSPAAPVANGYVPTGLGRQPTEVDEVNRKLAELAPHLKKGIHAKEENEQFVNHIINGIIAPAVTAAGSGNRR